MISLLAIAVAYSMSSFLPANTRGKIRRFIRFEMIQLIISIVILGALLAFASGLQRVEHLSQSLANTTDEPLPVRRLVHRRGLAWHGAYPAINIYATSVSYAIYASVAGDLPNIFMRFSGSGGYLGKVLYSNPLTRILLTKQNGLPPEIPFIGGICNGKNFCDYERIPSLDISNLYTIFSELYLAVYSPIILIAVGLLFVQFLALPIMQYLAFAILLPVALGMRSLAFFGANLGDASNALIAIAVAFYIVYPMMVAFDSYAINYVFSPSNPSAQYVGTAFTVNSAVTPLRYFQCQPTAAANPCPTPSATPSTWSLISGYFQSFYIAAFKSNSASVYIPFAGLLTSVHTYTNEMAQFIFQSVLLFALNVSVTIGFAVSLYKALKSGLGEAGGSGEMMMALPVQILLQSSSGFNTAAANLMPLVFAALLLDVCIVAIWYFLGVILANDSVKESAKGEYYQFLGTAVLVVILVWGITAYSGLSYTIMGSTRLMSPAAITTMCTSLVSTSNQLDILGADNSLLSGASTPSGETLTGICNMVSGSTLTDKINYPLAAAAVVTANMTAQTANNINGAYTYDAYIGFLSRLSPTISLCFGSGVACLVPGGAVFGGYWRTTLTIVPYAGYDMLYRGMGALGTLLSLSFEAYVAQLLVISIMLFIWPWLLFGGIVLRSTFFTRKIGGLLIAIVLGGMVVFPTIFGIEYAVLGNGIPGASALTPYNATYGFNVLSPGYNSMTPGQVIAPLPANTLGMPGNYITNFYIQPSMQQIAQANGCWPVVSNTGKAATLLSSALLGPIGSVAGIAIASGAQFSNPLATAELADIFYLLNPVTNAGSGIGRLVSSAGSTTGTYYLPAYCPQQGAIATNMEMLNSYGIIGVTLLPPDNKPHNDHIRDNRDVGTDGRRHEA